MKARVSISGHLGRPEVAVRVLSSRFQRRCRVHGKKFIPNFTTRVLQCSCPQMNQGTNKRTDTRGLGKEPFSLMTITCPMVQTFEFLSVHQVSEPLAYYCVAGHSY